MVEQKQQKASLKDVLNYEMPQRVSNRDIALIRNAFKDNEALVTAIKRVMIPSVIDDDVPPEYMGADRWMDLDFGPMQVDEIKAIVLARQYAIKFICGGLIQLKIIANQQEPTAQELALSQKENSNK